MFIKEQLYFYLSDKPKTFWYFLSFLSVFIILFTWYKSVGKSLFSVIKIQKDELIHLNQEIKNKIDKNSNNLENNESQKLQNSCLLEDLKFKSLNIDHGNILQQVIKIGLNNKLILNSADSKDIIKDNISKELITLEFTSNFEQLLKFLNQLKKTKFLFKLVSFNISDNISGKLNCKIELLFCGQIDNTKLNLCFGFDYKTDPFVINPIKNLLLGYGKMSGVKSEIEFTTDGTNVEIKKIPST